MGSSSSSPAPPPVEEETDNGVKFVGFDIHAPSAGIGFAGVLTVVVILAVLAILMRRCLWQRRSRPQPHYETRAAPAHMELQRPERSSMDPMMMAMLMAMVSQNRLGPEQTQLSLEHGQHRRWQHQPYARISEVEEGLEELPTPSTMGGSARRPLQQPAPPPPTADAVAQTAMTA